MACVLLPRSLRKIGPSKLRRWIFVIAIFIPSISLYCILFLGHDTFGLHPRISQSANHTNKLTKLSSSISRLIDIYPPLLSDTSLPLRDRTEEYVAICVAVKDQAWDLPEFIVHHYFHLGIKRFYIMDDGSKPPLAESLANTDFDDAVRSALTFVY